LFDEEEMISSRKQAKEIEMRRRLSLLLFSLGLAAVSLGGLSTPQAQASQCTYRCVLASGGAECCTFSDCSRRCFFNVVYGD
jgi:hypothetical protein